MSKARKIKKAAVSMVARYALHDGSGWFSETITGPADIRFSRNYEKRQERDPFYLVAQHTFPAPVKYSRCNVCVGRPHHSPWLDPSMR